MAQQQQRFPRSKQEEVRAIDSSPYRLAVDGRAVEAAAVGDQKTTRIVGNLRVLPRHEIVGEFEVTQSPSTQLQGLLGQGKDPEVELPCRKQQDCSRLTLISI
jgi:hypothetical protein